VAAATILANAATNLNTANTIVKRDSTGSFAAQIVSLVDTVATGNLVFTGATSTSTTGNVTKGGNRFIHNFGTNNTFMGINAGNFTMSGTNNNAFGVNALAANTTGARNHAFGTNALAANTTGFDNIAMGNGALQSNTSGAANTAIGASALNANTIASNMTAIGNSALAANT